MTPDKIGKFLVLVKSNRNKWIHANTYNSRTLRGAFEMFTRSEVAEQTSATICLVIMNYVSKKWITGESFLLKFVDRRWVLDETYSKKKKFFRISRRITQ